LSRRELRKTKYFTILSVWMIFLSIGLAIPCVIEGINIARNYYSMDLSSEEIYPGQFIQTNFIILESQRINLNVRSYTSDGYLDEAKVIITIMTEENFTDWISDGSPVPAILNSTYYFNISDLEIYNMELAAWDTNYIVIYNANPDPIKVNVEFYIIPWGHILTISILGFLLIVTSSTMIIKFISAAYFNSEDYIKDKLKKKKAVSKVENRNVKLHEESEERYCVSCGATLTPKDGQYCPNCGASIGN
jgi:hypothetical protein